MPIPHRSESNQEIRIAKQSGFGTPAASGFKRAVLLTWEFDSEPEGRDPIRPYGHKNPSDIRAGRERSDVRVGGPPTYEEMADVLSNIYGVPSSITQIGVTGAYTWRWTPKNGIYVPAPYTIERGDGTTVNDRAQDVILSSFGMTGSRESLNSSGSGFGVKPEFNISLTAGATDLAAAQQIEPDDWDLFIDDTSGGLGTTKFNSLQEWGWGVRNVYGPYWAVNSAKTSIDSYVDLAPEFTFDITPEADAQGVGLIDAMRTNTRKYVRLRALGPNIGAAADYLLQVDACTKVVRPGRYTSAMGVVAVPISLQAIRDSAWLTGAAYDITLVCKRAAI